MAAFSDFIIYVDESGSPNLQADAADFPVFVLIFLIVRKDHYVGSLVPSVQRLKFDFLGHDQIILHERDIRRQSGAFAFLQTDAALRTAFLDRVTEIVEAADVQVACAIIDKPQLQKRYAKPWDPYELALTFCMERAAAVLFENDQAGREVTVVFEARGSKEDQLLELEFHRIANGNPRLGKSSLPITSMQWKPLFIDKRANSSGLQMADLMARPLGLQRLRPDQANRAAAVARSKVVFPDPKIFP